MKAGKTPGHPVMGPIYKILNRKNSACAICFSTDAASGTKAGIFALLIKQWIVHAQWQMVGGCRSPVLVCSVAQKMWKFLFNPDAVN
ncbi:MAG: hypothetical protein PHE74_06200 [Comamonas sp.]|jgi:hypothetical protein|nr:hypothetical protein [Comamonas sp.]